MKNIFKIFAVVAACASLASCVKYAEYNTVPFASVDNSSYTVVESAAGTTCKIPVNVYNATSDCTVAYEIKDVTATQGVDYTVVGGAGVLNFPVGTTTQEITVNVTGQPGIFTGDVKFQVILKSATGGDVTIGSYDTCTINITDTDHPLLDLFGTYKMHSVDVNSSGSYSYFNWDIKLSEVPGDPTKIYIENPVVVHNYYGSYIPGTLKMWGYVNSAHDTIICPLPQDTGVTSANMFGYDNFVLLGWDGTNMSNGAAVTDPYDVIWTLTDGKWVTTNPYHLNCMGYQQEAPGDWLYYYMNCLATFNSAYPTYFAKE